MVGREGPHRLESFARTVSINLIGTFNMLRLPPTDASKAEPDAGGERRDRQYRVGRRLRRPGRPGRLRFVQGRRGRLIAGGAREPSRFGIRVMTIAPGIMETPMLMGTPQEVQDLLGKMVPLAPRQACRIRRAGAPSSRTPT